MHTHILFSAPHEYVIENTFTLIFSLTGDGPYDFLCNSSECIRSYDVCDGYQDCLDDSDELNCECKSIPLPLFVLGPLFLQ